NKDGFSVGLHWKLFGDNPREDLWQTSIELSMRDGAVRALSPPDQLLYVCGHEYMWGHQPATRWVVDAVTLLQRSGELDWDHLVREAKRHDQSAALCQMLGYLVGVFSIDIPPGVLTRLNPPPPPREHWVRIEPTAMMPLQLFRRARGARNRLWGKYLDTVEETGTKSSFAGFVRYLTQYWGLGAAWHLPLFVGRRLFRLVLGASKGPGRR
ncbi:MAG: nucleotidyltransferase family protein, partial [Acidobacteriota bacterium]